MKTHARRALPPLVLLAASALASAQDVPPPPKLEPLPDGAETAPEASDEPAITIRRQDGAEYKEYRVRGQIVAVKVTPQYGKPYWLINHNGEMQRHDGPSPNLTVPSWLILEW